MSIFGRRDLWAIEVDPLAGAPDEPDRAAAATWCALRLWAKGQNLTAHTRVDTLEASESLHWPAAYLARWFVNSWDDLWNRAGTPVAGAVIDPEAACRRLDRELAELEDEASDELLDRRDAFVASHSLLAAAGGGVMPHVYFLREGSDVHVVWREPEDPGDVRFHRPVGRLRLDAALFLESTRAFLSWVRETVAESAPRLAAEIEAWERHVKSDEAALRSVQGYAFPWAASDQRTPPSDLERVLELPAAWQRPGALVDPGQFPVAVVFRALSPVLESDEVLGLIQRLRSHPSKADAAAKLESLGAGLHVPRGESAYQQGYRLAEEVRRRLGNVDAYLDVEALLADLGVVVEEDELADRDIEAATVWDAAHGPFVLLNKAARRQVPWARRMTLAHELCHLLVDRRDAGLLIASTPWAPPSLERRANAFAAELLLSKAGILRVAGHRWASLDEWTREELMEEFGVGETVCIRHVENRFRRGDDGWGAYSLGTQRWTPKPVPSCRRAVLLEMSRTWRSNLPDSWRQEAAIGSMRLMPLPKRPDMHLSPLHPIAPVPGDDKTRRRTRMPAVLFFIASVALASSACTPTVRLRIPQPAPRPLPLAEQATAGATIVDLTPPPGMPMGGYASSASKGQGFRTRIQARILYLNDGQGQSMALVQADWIAGSLLIHHMVAARGAEATGLAPRQLAITASHTHSAPANFFENDFYNKHTTSGPWLSPRYLEFAVEQLSEGIIQAYRQRRPAKIAIGTAQVHGLSRNRSLKAYARNETLHERELDETLIASSGSDIDGARDTNQAVDFNDPEARFQAINPELTLIRVDAEDDDGVYKPLAAFSSFSMHNTTLSPPVQVYNADVYGFAQRDVEWDLQERARPSWKVVHALAQATVGDMAPALPERGDNWFSHFPVDWRASRELGQKLGREVIELFNSLEGQLSPSLTLASAARELNIRESNVADGVEICRDGAVGSALAAGAYERRLPGFTLVPSFRGGHVLARRQVFTQGCQGTKKHLGTPILQAIVEPKDSFPQLVMFQLLKINDMVMLPLPFEVTVEAGRRITRAVREEFEAGRVPLRHIWVASVANGYFGYATTPEEYAWQNYEGGHTLYGKNTTPFLIAQLQQLSSDYIAQGTVTEMLPDWEYELKTREFWVEDQEAQGTRAWLEPPTAVKGEKPHEEDYVRVRWLDVNSSKIELHEPLLSLQTKVGESWRELKVGKQPIDDQGYDLEVRLLKNVDRGMGRYEARWYNPVAGGEYRFVIEPREGQEGIVSPVFGWGSIAER